MMWKLGSCSRCMRQAFLGAVTLAVVAYAVLPSLPSPPWAHATVSIVLALLALLWLAHVIAFAHRSVSELRHLRRLRGAPLSIPATLHCYLQRLARGALMPVLGAFTDGCNCYLDYDCFAWRVCDYSAVCLKTRKGVYEVQLALVLDCPKSERLPDGRCDGRCAHWRALAAMPPEAVAAGIEAYFDLFIAAAARPDGAGLPLRRELAALESRLPKQAGQELRRAVYSLLDALVGWDLVLEDPDPFDLFPAHRDAFLGHIAHAEATPALLRAARSALGTALRSGNPDAVAPPLVQFWQAFPAYRPEHMGRCYPHGGHRYYEQAIDCHVAHLRRTVAAILRA